jgi:hypothetical protein
VLKGSLAGLAGLAALPAFARKVTSASSAGGSGTDPSTRRNAVEPFLQALQERGWIEGPASRSSSAGRRASRTASREWWRSLLRLAPDLIVTMGPRPAIVVRGRDPNHTVVAIFIDDPVSMGLAESPRPAGTQLHRRELVRDRADRQAPGAHEATRAGGRAGSASSPIRSRRSRAASRGRRPAFEQGLGIQVVIVEASAPAQFEAAFAALSRQGVDGVLVVADATFYAQRCPPRRALQPAQAAVGLGRPRLSRRRAALASYQSDVPHMFRRGASLVDAILRGAKPPRRRSSAPPSSSSPST